MSEPSAAKLNLPITLLQEAFAAVKANQGCAGVDRVSIERYDRNRDLNLLRLRNELLLGRYRPLPLMQIIVAKKNGEGRKLCIPTVRDRTVQKAVALLIGPEMEAEFEDCSYAYRPGRSVKMLASKITSLYEQGFRWVVDADIDAYFDNVDHDLLRQKVARSISDPDIRGIIDTWMKAEVWDGRSVRPIEKGIPQGSPLSPVLANLFLDELDEAMLGRNFRYLRYADDFIILCRKPQSAEKALQLSKEVLERLKLTLDEEEIVSFDQGFKYLGLLFLRSMVMQPLDLSGKASGVLYMPPPMNLKAYLLRRDWKGQSIRRRPWSSM